MQAYKLIGTGKPLRADPPREVSMSRKAALALAAVAALAVSMQPGSASAGWQGRSWHGGAWPGGGWGWPVSRWGYGYFGEFPSYGYDGYYGCWRTARVETPAGPRWYRQWLCY